MLARDGAGAAAPPNAIAWDEFLRGGDGGDSSHAVMDATCSSAHCLGSNTSGVIAFCKPRSGIFRASSRARETRYSKDFPYSRASAVGKPSAFSFESFK